VMIASDGYIIFKQAFVPCTVFPLIGHTAVILKKLYL
jgi:hypothetical protein